jgi:SAM-dependent methyltransferase
VLRSTDDVLALLDAGFTSAALAAALELGLLGRIADHPLPLAAIADAYGIPLRRCGYWLELLATAGLVERAEGGWRATELARRTVLDAYHAETWRMLAAESRRETAGTRDFALHLAHRGSVRQRLGAEVEHYVAHMARDPAQARLFTRALYELHAPFARALAERLDFTGVSRLLDLGGGSGVMSFALLERHPALTAVVMDIANVCEEGRRIAAERGLSERVAFVPGDFRHDPLPGRFGRVLACDVGVYEPGLFQRVCKSLAPGGRFVVVDQYAPAEGVPHPARVVWAISAALDDPDHAPRTLAQATALLADAGFVVGVPWAAPEPPSAATRMVRGFTVIESVPR